MISSNKIMSRWYAPDDMQLLATLQNDINTNLRKNQAQHEIIRHSAAIAYSIAVAAHRVTGVDIRTVRFPVVMAPWPTPLYPEDHPFQKLLSCLDKFSIQFIRDADSQDKDSYRKAEDVTRFNAALIWKGYLLAMITPPNEWEPDDLCALGSLRILSSVSGVDVADMSKKYDPRGGSEVTPDAWPAPGFIQMYFDNRGRIAAAAGWKLDS